MNTRIESTGPMARMALNTVDVKGSTAAVAYLPGLAPREGEIETPNFLKPVPVFSLFHPRIYAARVVDHGRPVGDRCDPTIAAVYGPDAAG